jgi:ubiquinone/menaquinone biosynthesis C-methylase UbiE
MWLERPKHFYATLAERFRGRRILDVGCGRTKFPGAVGIDIRSHLSRADVFHDLDRVPWPLPDDGFDLVVMRHCLEHLRDIFQTMDELYRITTPGGRIVIEVPHFSWSGAFQHPGHLHFLSAGSLDFFHPGNQAYRAQLRIVRRRIYFNDFFKVIGVEALANRFSYLYERHFAFILPAGTVIWELEAVKAGAEVSRA